MVEWINDSTFYIFLDEGLEEMCENYLGADIEWRRVFVWASRCLQIVYHRCVFSPPCGVVLMMKMDDRMGLI